MTIEIHRHSNYCNVKSFTSILHFTSCYLDPENEYSSICLVRKYLFEAKKLCYLRGLFLASIDLFDVII